MLSVLGEIRLGLYTATVYLIFFATTIKHKDWDHHGDVAKCKASVPYVSLEHQSKILSLTLQTFMHKLNFMYCD